MEVITAESRTLQSISCDHANLQHIPGNLPKDTKIISMNGNDFTIIDKDFAHLHQLRSLDLQELISNLRITVRIEIFSIEIIV